MILPHGRTQRKYSTRNRHYAKKKKQLCHASRNICSQDVRPALKEVSTLRLYFKDRPSCRGKMGRK